MRWGGEGVGCEREHRGGGRVGGRTVCICVCVEGGHTQRYWIPPRWSLTDSHSPNASWQPLGQAHSPHAHTHSETRSLPPQCSNSLALLESGHNGMDGPGFRWGTTRRLKSLHLRRHLSGLTSPPGKEAEMLGSSALTLYRLKLRIWDVLESPNYYVTSYIFI